MKPALDAGMLTADDGCLDTVSAIWLGYVGKHYPRVQKYPCKPRSIPSCRGSKPGAGQ
jgi:hypothetical protein